MISGNYFGNIFENNKNVSTNFQKIMYKFFLKIKFEIALNVIYNYFNTVPYFSRFCSYSEGKYLVEIYEKNVKIIMMIFSMYKVKDTKFILSFTFKQVNFSN